MAEPYGNGTSTQTAGAADVSPAVAAARSAGRAIPPLWPLATSVAVNPFLGQTDEDLAAVAARLGRVGGIRVTPPRARYRQALAEGDLTREDLAAALAAAPPSTRPSNLEALLEALEAESPDPRPVPTVATLAARASGVDWPGLIAARMGVWAADHYDSGQALWAAPREPGAFASWRAFASQDLTPEIVGLRDFAAHVAAAPDRAETAVERAVERLGLAEAALPTYFHALLFELGGWAQYARHLQWQAERDGERSEAPLELLAMRLVWEEALWAQEGGTIEAEWTRACAAHARPLAPDPDQVIDAILQEAAERAAQRRLIEHLPAAPGPLPSRPALQAAFCIDVRSEVFRRALEASGRDVVTLGFAGFFGLAAAHRGFASDVEEARAPVLLEPAISTTSGGPADAEADFAARLRARASRAWGRFKLAAVSSFAFVEAAGPVYVGRLLRDALGWREVPAPGGPAPRPEPALDLATRVDAAATVLRAMSLTDGFAPLVLLVGHGARVTNNPHASALDCGACGGHAGDVNARLLAGLLNDPDVRGGLAAAGIEIPADTVFVGALHDTTTDQVTLYDGDLAPGTTAGEHGPALDRAREQLAAAGALARAERAPRLPRAKRGADVLRRARDWAEVRPEWGLAGCRAFVAAPRERTRSLNLGGGAFLHDYDWHGDAGFGVLELILTAPVVVASWISLQYYGSTVAPTAFGAGNKLLHNVTGGIGVVEGNGGVLRAGLPWQSVHDGADFVHDPLRLSVYVQAPREAIADVLERHPDVATLFEQRWLHLLMLDDADGSVWRYAGNGTWALEHDGVDRALAVNH